MQQPAKAHLMDATAMDRALTRIAHEIVERNRGIEKLYLVGIQRRGVPLAERIADRIARIEGERPGVGILDITFYRDDLSLLNQNPVVNATEISCAIYDYIIVLVDDVIYTGRTVRAAIEAIFDMGRPARIQLAVMIDRGHRELPLRPDFVGKNVPTSRSEQIEVSVVEIDGFDSVDLYDREEYVTVHGGVEGGVR
ncbi:MAG: bifunctional pyr operon transcriptional regulator/uracil phosphoribosyltransferase PyrR [Bacillota bacterium]|nr:bifunctional pyr operon transcriptional regulator/uracil phosphoribosyltransferase PyrR [Bacillota bacterium]